MKNKKFIPIVLSITLVSLLVFMFFNNDKNEIAPSEQVKAEKIKIAACPACFDMAKKLNSEKYQIVATASTAESIELIKNQQADLMLAGRTLKPGEPNMDYIVINEGYSFLGAREAVIYINELKNYTAYTDLNVDSIKNDFPVGKIEKVDDVYQYLNKGLVITSWENTDYTRAEIIHVLENNGERAMLSRRPTIYCLKTCDNAMVASLVSALK